MFAWLRRWKERRAERERQRRIEAEEMARKARRQDALSEMVRSRTAGSCGHGCGCHTPDDSNLDLLNPLNPLNPLGVLAQTNRAIAEETDTQVVTPEDAVMFESWGNNPGMSNKTTPDIKLTLPEIEIAPPPHEAPNGLEPISVSYSPPPEPAYSPPPPPEPAYYSPPPPPEPSYSPPPPSYDSGGSSSYDSGSSGGGSFGGD
jgi:hypothetical protein